MRLHVGLLIAIVTITSLTSAQVCEPTTPLTRQFRSAMKHRSPGPSHDRAVAVGELATWPAPADVADYRTRSADEAIDPRERAAAARWAES